MRAERALKRLAMAIAALLGAWALGAPASASGDYACTPGWSLDSPDLFCSSSIVIAPGNDTRVNLSLLLRDRAGLAAKPGTYPDIDWDYSFAHNYFDWSTFAGAAYPFVEQADVDYPGSRCISLKGGDAAFTAAVAASSRLTQQEREALVAARGELAAICSTFGGSYWVEDNSEPQRPAAPSWPVDVASRQGKEFLAYLVAAAAFYGEDWDSARGGFAGLANSADPWLKETARYMQGRLELNVAQASSFGEWGDFDPARVDRAAAGRAARGLSAYLSAYPQGRYAASAKGLQRRVLWLTGDLAGLADAYEALLAATAPGSDAEARLIEEVDNKLLFEKGAATAIDTPLLLATIDLARMRARAGAVPDSEFYYAPPAIDEGELAAQEPRFKGREELYGLLRATYSYYVAGDAQDVLLRIADNSVTPNHSALDFSRQVLRGQALAALKDPGEEAFWLRLIGTSGPYYQRPTAELGLALMWERAGRLEKIFAADSPIGETMIRKILIESSAGPTLLRVAAKDAARPQNERDLALFVLLYKQLSRGFYASWLTDVAMVPRGANTDSGLWDLKGSEPVPVGLFTAGTFSEAYACPALGVTVAALARNAKDVKGRLCLGDFYRLNGFDDFSFDYVADPETLETDGLGYTAHQFPGTAIPRQGFYTAIIADPAAARADKAYAYYRAVKCYAPSGNNTCGGDDAPESQRKAWFNALKRQYGDTKWAKELKYYW